MARHSAGTKAARARTPVESLKHKDKRANIPTRELRDFVAEQEKSPATMLYPRDPSLDPSLSGKARTSRMPATSPFPSSPSTSRSRSSPTPSSRKLVEPPRDLGQLDD